MIGPPGGENAKSADRFLRSTAAWGVGTAVAVAAVTLLLYWRMLNTFFFTDDFAVLVLTAPQTGNAWWDCFRPYPIGFWRPAGGLVCHAAAWAGGLHPFAFHLTELALHGEVAWLTGLVALRCFGFTRWWATVAALMMAAHVAAFRGAVQICNSFDVLLAVALLVGLLAWHRALAAPPPVGRIGWIARFAPTAAAFALALMSKETGVVFPAIMAAWMFVPAPDAPATSPPRPRWPYRFFIAAMVVVAVGHAAGLFWLQSHSRGSYITEGYLQLSPARLIRSLVDNSLGPFFPYFFLIETPGGGVAWPAGVVHAWRFIVLLAGGAGAVAMVRGRSPASRRAGFCVVAVFVIMAIPALQKSPPTSRAVYSALPFGVLALWSAVRALRGSARALAVAVVAVLAASFLASFAWSPTVVQWPEKTARYERFVQEIVRVSADWPGEGVVAFYNHPAEMGGPTASWAYLQHALTVFVPGKKIVPALDHVPSGTVKVYQWTPDETLREMTGLQK